MYRKRCYYQMEKCKYCDGVECSAPERAKCGQCGWNPKIMEQRLENLQKGQVLHNERV